MVVPENALASDWLIPAARPLICPCTAATDAENAAALQDAEEKLSQADDALRKYLRFERRQKRDSLDLSISNSETKLDDANETYRNYKANPETDTDEAKQKEYKKQNKMKKRLRWLQGHWICRSLRVMH